MIAEFDTDKPSICLRVEINFTESAEKLQHNYFGPKLWIWYSRFSQSV